MDSRADLPQMISGSLIICVSRIGMTIWDTQWFLVRNIRTQLQKNVVFVLCAFILKFQCPCALLLVIVVWYLNGVLFMVSLLSGTRWKPVRCSVRAWFSTWPRTFLWCRVGMSWRHAVDEFMAFRLHDGIHSDVVNESDFLHDWGLAKDAAWARLFQIMQWYFSVYLSQRCLCTLLVPYPWLQCSSWCRAKPCSL